MADWQTAIRTPSTPPNYTQSSQDVTKYKSSVTADAFDSSDEDDDSATRFMQTPEAPFTPYFLNEKNETPHTPIPRTPADPPIWIPEYMNEKRNTRLDSLIKKIEEHNDPKECPLVKSTGNLGLLPFVNMHFAFMSRHIAGRIYLIREETQGKKDRPGEPYAMYEQVSGDLTKFRFSFNGKNDYNNAANLYRDMYYSIFKTRPPPSKKSKSSEARDRGWDYLEIWINGDPQYVNAGMRSFSKPDHYPLLDFHPSCVRLPHSASNFVNTKLPSMGILVPNYRQYPQTPQTPATPTMAVQTHNTTLMPVESFNLDSDLALLQQQHYNYRSINASDNNNNNSLSTNFVGTSIFGTSDSTLKTSEPNVRELYSCMMQKAKLVVHWNENERSPSKKEEIYKRMIQLSHNFDQVLFGSAPEAEETLNSKAPPRFIPNLSNMNMSLLESSSMIPSSNSGGGKRKRKIKRLAVLDYNSTSSEDDDQYEQESKCLKHNPL